MIAPEKTILKEMSTIPTKLWFNLIILEKIGSNKTANK